MYSLPYSVSEEKESRVNKDILPFTDVMGYHLNYSFAVPSVPNLNGLFMDWSIQEFSLFKLRNV